MPVLRQPVADATVRIGFTLPALPSHGGADVCVSAQARQQSNRDGYQAMVCVGRTGRTWVQVVRGHAPGRLLAVRGLPLTVVAGQPYYLELQTQRAGSMQLAAKVWAADAPEPDWQVRGVDHSGLGAGPIQVKLWADTRVSSHVRIDSLQVW